MSSAARLRVLGLLLTVGCHPGDTHGPGQPCDNQSPCRPPLMCVQALCELTDAGTPNGEVLDAVSDAADATTDVRDAPIGDGDLISDVTDTKVDSGDSAQEALVDATGDGI